jgi:putative MATE family efflux protein
LSEAAEAEASKLVPDPGEHAGVWELAWPTMAAFGLQTVVGFVDMLFVSQLGTEAVAGVGIGSQIHFVAFALFAAVGTGTVALVSRAVGAGDERAADHTLQLSLVLSAMAGLILMLFAGFAHLPLQLFGAAPEVTEIGTSYLRILLVASVPLGIGMTLANGMRAAGDVRTPLIAGVLTNIINVIGDYALIFGNLGAPALGTDGSAWATMIAMTIGTVVYFAAWFWNYLAIPRGPLLRSLPASECRRIIRIGIPSALEQLAFNVGLFLFLRLVTEFGTPAVSAYMIGVRILAFSFIPGLGFATAASTLVGQHLGRERPDLAESSGWKATGGGMAVMTSAGAVIIFFADPISGMFGAAGGETHRLTTIFIYILGAVQPLMAMEFTISGALRGAGDTRFPLISLLTGLFVFRLGVASLLLYFTDPDVVAIWCCLLADYLVKATLLTLRFRRGSWKKLVI